MKRRDVLKSLAAAVAMMSTPAVMAAPEPVTRHVFLVETKLVETVTYQRIRHSDDLMWGQVQRVVPITDSHLSVTLNPILFHSLQKGDVFVMYESTGELVGNLSGNPVLVAESDSFIDPNGRWSVQADVYKETYTVPSHMKYMESVS